MKHAWMTAVCLAGLVQGAAWRAEAKKVGILVSKNLPAYQEVLANFEKNLEADFVVENLQGQAEMGQSWLQSQVDHMSLLAAIGPEALQSLQKNLTNIAPKIPFVYAMVLAPPDSALQGSGVLLQLSLEDQVAQIRRLFPKAKKLGVLYTPAYSTNLIREAEQVARERGFILALFPIQKSEDVLTVLANVTPEAVDVFWTLVDRNVIQPANMGAIIHHALQVKLPMIGLSAYHVEAGALAAFSVEFAAIGRQTAVLAARILSGEQQALHRVETPAHVTVFINRTTQRKIGLAAFPDFSNLQYKE